MLEVEEAVKNSNKIYMAGFLRRFLQKGVILKSFVESGKLGEVFYGEACFRRRVGNPGGWFANKALSGGGPLIDIGVHIIDLAIYLMGKPKAVAVSAATFNKIGGRNNIKMIERYRPREYDDYCDVEDSVFALIRFDNGSILQCKCSFSEHVKNNYMNIELQGSKGGATFEPKLEIYTEENDYLTDITPVYTEYTEPLQYMMDQEISHFIKCINGEAECISPIGDAVQMMRIIDAIYKSAELKREVEI
jgi:predicted dehydrogenase